MKVVRKETAPTYDIIGLSEEEARDLFRLLSFVSAKSTPKLWENTQRIFNELLMAGLPGTTTNVSTDDCGRVKYAVVK